MTVRTLDRRELLAAVAAGVGIAVSGGAPATTMAAFRDQETDSDGLDTGVWDSYPRRVTYTNGGTLRSATDSTTSGYSLDGTDVLGPVETGFDGSDYHVPVVDGNGDLLRVAADGTETAFGLDASRAPRGTKATLATATWNGHPRSVYYPGDGASNLYRVAPGGSAEHVAQLGNGIKAALGTGDIDDDGVAEFVFVDGSATVRYIVPATDSTSRTVESTGKSPGSNNNYGVGSPVDVDGYGTVVPAVNGSGALALLDASGWAASSLTSGSTAKKAPVFGCDFDDDGNAEIAFVGYDNGYLHHLNDVGGSNSVVTVTDDAGDPLAADAARGVR